MKSFKNVYSHQPKKKYMLFLCILLIVTCIFSRCSIKNKESEEKAKNKKIITQNDGSYDMQELYATSVGKQIYGELYMPKSSSKKVPVVIYSHGFGGTHEYGIEYALELTKIGYAVYCFDFCGGSPSSQSDSSTLEMSIFTEQADLEAVIAMIQDLDFVDRNNIFLLGSSQGGVVSAITAAKNQKVIRGIILLYPAFVLVDNAKELFDSVDEIPESYYHMWMTVGKNYFEKLLDYDVYKDISLYDKDVLIIHGDKDSIVPLSYSQKAVDIYSSAKLYVIEGAGHGFHNEEFEIAMRYISDYLVENTEERDHGK